MRSIIVLFIVGLLNISIIFSHPSWGIVVDNSGNIYFADINHNGRGSVWKLTKEGKLILLLSDFHAHNVNLDKAGNLITANGEDHHTMVRIQGDGSIDTLVHELNHLDFFGGNSAYSDRDIIFGINNYLWRIDETGAKCKLSDYKFGWNQAVYPDGYGSFYAPEIGNGKGKIIKINIDGSYDIFADNLISKLDRPYDKHSDVLLGITQSEEGNIYVAETAGQRIIEIAKDNNVRTFYRSKGDWFPTGIDFFEGEAYILEFKMKGRNEGPKITKINVEGRVEEIFNYEEYFNN